jgi:hypothetical protein
MQARRDHRDGCFARSWRAAARPPSIERVKEVDGSRRKRDSCDMLKKRRRLTGVATMSLLLAVVAACTLTMGIDSYSNGNCGAGEKACADDKGVTHCIGFDHPEFGCARAGCLPCSLPNSTQRCDPSNQCIVAACNSGWAHCTNVLADGCETSISSDPHHCGVLPNGPQGACTIDCDNTVLAGDTKALHIISSACISGACQIGGCTLNYHDCDKQISNGCECAPPGVCTPTGGCAQPSDAGAADAAADAGGADASHE